MKRKAFTLMEVLVVIAIIAVLVGLTSVGLQKATALNKLKVTENRVFKLQKALSDERRTVISTCERDARERTIPAPVVAFCDGDISRAREVWTAAKLRQHFPLTFSDATTSISFNGYTLQPLATFGEVSGAVPPTIDAEATNELDESGALLFLVLAEWARSGEAFGMTERMPVLFGARELTTFKDAWNRPIGFRMNYKQAPGSNPLLRGWNLSMTDPRLSILTALEPYEQTRIISVQSKGENPTRGGVTDDVLGELLYHGKK